MIQQTWDGSLYILRGHRFIFPTKIKFISLNIVLILANSEDPNEMQHYAAFHWSLHCLQKYMFRGFQYIKG